MAFVKPLSVIHTQAKSGTVVWEFHCVNGHYFATNWNGGHKDAKSFKDLMRIKAIFLSYKKSDGSSAFKVGFGRPKKTDAKA